MINIHEFWYNITVFRGCAGFSKDLPLKHAFGPKSIHI